MPLLLRSKADSMFDRGTRVCGAKGWGAVAVAEEAVADDCDAPRSPNVPEDIVLGDAICDMPPSTRNGLSPPCGPVPRYISACTMQPWMFFPL